MYKIDLTSTEKSRIVELLKLGLTSRKQSTKNKSVLAADARVFDKFITNLKKEPKVKVVDLITSPTVKDDATNDKA